MLNAAHRENLVILLAGEFQQFRNNLKIAREKERKKLIGFMGLDDDLNRQILEKEKVDFFLITLSNKKDKMKQRDSGFNQVLAKEAKKKNIVIGINLDEIIGSEKKVKNKIIGRLIQNIEICNRNKLNMKFISPSEKNERNIYDLRSLGLVLGMPTWMTKNL